MCSTHANVGVEVHARVRQKDGFDLRTPVSPLVENRVGFHPPAATGLVSEKELIHPVTALKTLCDVTDRDFLVSKVTDSPSCRYGQNISST